MNMKSVNVGTDNLTMNDQRPLATIRRSFEPNGPAVKAGSIAGVAEDSAIGFHQRVIRTIKSSEPGGESKAKK
jgi:hypothetical protein